MTEKKCGYCANFLGMGDWSKWSKFTSTGDDTEPEVRSTKATDNGIRVNVYLGWDYGHNDDIEEYVKAVKEKFEAFASIVRKQEPSWSVKLVKSHGSRGVTWTNYWAQVTAKLSMTESVHDYFNIDKYYIRGNDEDAIRSMDDPELAEYLVKCEEVDPGCKHVCWLIARDRYLDALDEFALVELVDCGDEVGEFPAIFVRDRVYNITEEIMNMLGIDY